MIKTTWMVDGLVGFPCFFVLMTHVIYSIGLLLLFGSPLYPIIRGKMIDSIAEMESVSMRVWV